MNDEEGIDITPTRNNYINMLKIVIRNSKIKKDVEWAMDELTRVHRMKFRGEGGNKNDI